jgi:transposase
VSIVDRAAVLLPHLAALRLNRVWLKGVRVQIEATTTAEQVNCPGCGTSSHRVHSRYARHLAEAGLGGSEVTIVLTVRRLFCDQPDCTN